MRLIDADALAEWLGITDVDCSKCVWGDHGFCRRGGDFEDACVGIEDAPTIDAVPVVRCKDCVYFDLNHFETVNGVPIIVAHEICTFWGNGCKTRVDGYCSFARKDGDVDG